MGCRLAWVMVTGWAALCFAAVGQIILAVICGGLATVGVLAREKDFDDAPGSSS